MPNLPPLDVQAQPRHGEVRLCSVRAGQAMDDAATTAHLPASCACAAAGGGSANRLAGKEIAVPMSNELTAARLRELLHYDAETGVFTWRVSRGSTTVGAIAGSPHTQGYICIQVDRRLYRAHRLAWLHFYGLWPNGELDHINRLKDDNRIANLREVTRSQNEQNKPLPKNNSSGLRGASLHRPNGKWRAQITKNNRVIYLGLFDTPEAASAAYRAAAAKFHALGVGVA